MQSRRLWIRNVIELSVMDTSTPLVSVIVPSFNVEPHIVRSSLESIRNQTFSNFECIVVDESNNFGLAEACRSVCAEDPRFIYVHPTERLRLPNSLNLGISLARGKLIARFDSDDICMPDRLALQVAFLEAHPDISIVGGSVKIIDEDGQSLSYRRYPESFAKIAKGMQLTTTMAHPTVMFRKEVIEHFGGYHPKFLFAEDLDLWLRWLNSGLRFANLAQVLVHYRQTNTRRKLRHWGFNLRARLSNFNTQYWPLRVLGIACILIWGATPKILQEHIFRFLILQRRSNRSSS